MQEQLTALREHLDKISGPLEQRRATAWLGSTDTLSLCTTLAGQCNSGRISLACLPGSPSLPETLSAAYCAVAAGEEDPARPLNTLVLTGVAVPPESSRLSRTEQEVALKNGVTPLEVGPGEVVQIVRAISTYTRNAAGATDISLLDMTTIRTLDYVARTVKERIDLRFPREKLSTRTPPKVRSEVLDVLRQLEQLEIVEWYRKVKFRKNLLGGVDEVQMWKKLEELYGLYENAIRAERARYNALLEAHTPPGENHEEGC